MAYELKYCERCGSLGLRRAASGASYCPPCREILQNISSLRDEQGLAWWRSQKGQPAGRRKPPMPAPEVTTLLAGRVQ